MKGVTRWPFIAADTDLDSPVGAGHDPQWAQK